MYVRVYVHMGVYVRICVYIFQRSLNHCFNSVKLRIVLNPI